MEEFKNAYEIKEKKIKKFGFANNNSTITGPENFSCTLGEPEDRTWERDGEGALRELNRLHNLLCEIASGVTYPHELPEDIYGEHVC